MITKLVLENLKHKPLRSLLSILIIGIPVTLILTLVGLSHGMLADSARRARGSGADLMVKGSTAGAVLGGSAATLNEKLADFIAGQPHVTAVMGVVTHPAELPLVINGIDLDQFNKMRGGVHYVEGHGFQDEFDVLLSRSYAGQRKKHAGDTIEVMNRQWHVAGIVEDGQLASILTPLRTMQDLDAATHKLTQVYVKVDDPVNIPAVKAELLQKLGSSYSIWTMEEFARQVSESVNKQGLSEFVGVVIGIGVVIGFAVVCLSMYMSVLQRTREIGILKSLGGSKPFILQIIWMEALLLGVGGSVLGILLSYAAAGIIHTLKPASFQVQIVYAWWPIAAGITLVGATLGSLYPGITAANHDPIEALAYE